MNEQIHSAEVRGMSLRDWFAGMAIQGLLANPGGPIQESVMDGGNWGNCTPMQVAQQAYGVADAMLEARGQNEPPRTIEPWMHPLPDGAVLLGEGGTFKVPMSDGFEGWVAEPDAPRWDWDGRLAGLAPHLYYAAPADSEIARLNGPKGGEA